MDRTLLVLAVMSQLSLNSYDSTVLAQARNSLLGVSEASRLCLFDSPPDDFYMRVGAAPGSRRVAGSLNRT